MDMDMDNGTWPEYNPGQIADHVFPGVGFVVCALLLAYPWREFEEPPRPWWLGARLRGEKAWPGRFIGVAGTTVLLMGIVGCAFAVGMPISEGRGLLANAMHQAMLFGFVQLGAVALLGGIDGPWPTASAVAFFSLGLIFYGHAMEKDADADEAAHFLVFVYGSVTSALFLVLQTQQRSYLLRLVCAFAVFAVGVWFFALAHIIYSGQVNPSAMEVYLIAGFVLQVTALGFFGVLAAGAVLLPPRAKVANSKV